MRWVTLSDSEEERCSKTTRWIKKVVSKCPRCRRGMVWYKTNGQTWFLIPLTKISTFQILCLTGLQLKVISCQMHSWQGFQDVLIYSQETSISSEVTKPRSGIPETLKQFKIFVNLFIFFKSLGVVTGVRKPSQAIFNLVWDSRAVVLQPVVGKHRVCGLEMISSNKM